VHTNRFRQIAIAFGVFGNQLTHARQDMEGVGVVGFAERLNNRFENSSTSRRPPGFSTRYIERSAFSLSVTLRRPKEIVMQSKVLSANGSASAFA
jgi:hypothetical protein